MCVDQFGFKLYFRTRRSVLQACGKPEDQVEGLKKAEVLLLEDTGFGHFRELGLLYEQKMLALLREDKAQDGVRKVVVKDAMQVAHRLLGGSDKDSLSKADDKNRDGCQKPDQTSIAIN